jgi:CRISPR-associated protein Csb1
MPLDFTALEDSPRLLIEAELQPLQGTRFQPTGFPDIGAAEYNGPDGTSRTVLVESPQSMANRLEAVCWDEVADDWVRPLRGLPLVKVTNEQGTPITNSVLEAHRINSEYIAREDQFEPISAAIGYEVGQPFSIRTQLVPALLKYDINSLIHGVFLEEIAGVIRLPRSLSSFIEAYHTSRADSGGVKLGLDPTRKDGEGNVPFARSEFTSPKIVAYFNLDLAQLRGFGLGSNTERLLVAIALFKIQRLLATGLRLRTACDFDLVSPPHVTKPVDFTFPATADLENELPSLIAAVRKEGLFADPPATIIIHKGDVKKGAARGKRARKGDNENAPTAG